MPENKETPENRKTAENTESAENNEDPSLNVALSPEQYRRAVEDFKHIFANANSANTTNSGESDEDHLTFFRKQSSQIKAAETQSQPDITMEHYFPEGETQGYLIIKKPINNDSFTILQVPHAFFDLHSLEIAQEMFDTQWADVLMVNTQHRYKTPRSDLSRLRYSIFTAVVEALQPLNLQVKIIQIHGFNETKRKTISARNADFILSNGSVVPDTYMLQLQSCIRDNTLLLARTYGRDVFELGATVNPVGKLVNSYKQAVRAQSYLTTANNPSTTNNRPATSNPILATPMQFLHVEISRNIRNAMIRGERILSNTGSSGSDNNEVLKCLLNH